MEGNAFRYNPKTGKVVLSSHYEDENGYTAAKIYLAQITPKGKLEVGTMERPLGHDSRDQSLFIDDDNTAYLLSATNTNSDINIYKLDASWTKPVELVNTICKGLHRETPAIIKKTENTTSSVQRLPDGIQAKRCIPQQLTWQVNGHL